MLDAACVGDAELRREVESLLSRRDGAEPPRLSPPSRLDGYGISSDNRLLYYGLATKEADVWLLDIE